MVEYIPFAVVVVVLCAASVGIGWPWLRQPQTREKAMMLCAVGVFCALAVYLAAGDPFVAAQIDAQRDALAQQSVRAEELRKKLAASDAPDSAQHAEHWLELAAIAADAGNAMEAEDALKHAVVASGGHPQVIMAYGKAQMATANGQMTEGAKQALEIASRLQPEDPEPLLLLAMGYMQAGQPAEGRALLQKALPLLPDDSPMRGFIVQRMQEADAKRAAPTPK